VSIVANGAGKQLDAYGNSSGATTGLLLGFPSAKEITQEPRCCAICVR